jgi:hypothetical protein
MPIIRELGLARSAWQKCLVAVFVISAGSVGFFFTAGTAQAAAIAWRRDVPAAAREAASSNKPLLLTVTARWCGPCHKMLQQSFPDPSVAARVNASFVPLLIEADEQQFLVKQWNINAFPTMLVLNSQQHVMERVTGYQSAAQLDARLAAYRPPAETRVVPRPLQVSPAPRQAVERGNRPVSFHDRAWAWIRSSPSREPRPAPNLPIPRDTLAAAKEFSAGR